MPCPAGTSTEVQGGACVPCRSGQFAPSGGLCEDCPAGTTSNAGQTDCIPCEFGTEGVGGGVCQNRCPGGQAYSILLKLCTICNIGTFARAGATACTRCPIYKYSWKESEICIPDNYVGGYLEVDADCQATTDLDLQRGIGNLFDVDSGRVRIFYRTCGSTIIYFGLDNEDDDGQEIFAPENVAIQQLSGNELMLLFYQWYVVDDARLQNFEWPIINFRIYLRTLTTASSDKESFTSVVNQLFVSDSPTAPAIIPPNPFFRTSSEGFTLVHGYGRNIQKGTVELEFTVSSASNSRLSLCIALLLIAISFMFVGWM
jgi:hypothetical protein